MPEFLLELGAEELPAFEVERAYLELGSSIEKELRASGLLPDDAVVTTMGTPRRLIVGISGLLPQEPDSEKEQRGPSLSAAYQADGSPTGALNGFCRSQGVAVESLRNDGQYVWASKKIAGRPALQVLSEVAPKAIRGLTFEKTMRWGTSRFRFARPIRWILACLDEEAVLFEIEGVSSGLASFGHRLYAPSAFPACTLSQLLQELRSRFVEPDPSVRRKLIVDGARSVTVGEVELPEPLVDENVFLTEWPTAIRGYFHPSFLELPEPVLVIAMAKHERMFPVRGMDGKLTNEFVFVRNSGQDDSVQAGCEWVLNARFNDARFFFEEDKKSTLDDFREQTSRIVFAEGLGTVLQRSERMEALSSWFANDASLPRAAHYCKADLATGLVGELASLQGVIGGEYARREGLSEEVCWAIAHQYNLAGGAAGESAARSTAIHLVILDQVDKLAGYSARGQMPSGSSDPYGLRRAATLVIEAAWLLDAPIAYAELLKAAGSQYAAQEFSYDADAYWQPVLPLIDSRYRTLLPDTRYDVLDAVLGTGAGSNPVDCLRRIRLTETLAADTALIQTLTRPINIVRAAAGKGISDGNGKYVVEDLGSAPGVALYEAMEQAPAATVEDLKSLAPLIDAYFDGTMMMVDDPKTRTARLGLNRRVMDYVLTLADVTKLVIEGT